MKNNILILILFFGGISCDKKCQDCEPNNSAKYFITNSLNQDIQFFIFGDSTTQHKIDTLVIKSNESKAFIFYSVGKPSSTLLSFDINQSDTLKMTTLNNSPFNYSLNAKNCADKNNILCTDNYKLISKNEEKDGATKSEFEIEFK